MPHLPMEKRRTTFEEVELGFSPETATRESRRCLGCGCGKAIPCRLRQFATEYGVDPQRFVGERRHFARDASHPDIIFEPGKCIMCGACVQVAAQAGEEWGVSFVGRGFQVAVAVPFGRPMAEALRKSARRAAEVCPTGAIMLRPTGASPAVLPKRKRIRLRYGLHAPGTDGRMRWVRSDIRFPMPAALALLTRRFPNGDSDGGVWSRDDLELGDIQQLTQGLGMFLGLGEHWPGAGDRKPRFERLANVLCLAGLLQFRQRLLAETEQRFPRFALRLRTREVQRLPVSRCAESTVLPGTNSHASSAVKARIGASILQRLVTIRWSAVCVERRRGEFAASV